MEEYHGVITKDNRICCDNKGALFTFEKKSKRVPSGKANTDIQRVLRTINARTKSNFVQQHVKAHQDEVKKWSQMTYEEKLHFRCDRLAKEAIKERRKRPKQNQTAVLFLQSTKALSQATSMAG